MPADSICDADGSHARPKPGRVEVVQPPSPPSSRSTGFWAPESLLPARPRARRVAGATTRFLGWSEGSSRDSLPPICPNWLQAGDTILPPPTICADNQIKRNPGRFGSQGYFSNEPSQRCVKLEPLIRSHGWRKIAQAENLAKPTEQKRRGPRKPAIPGSPDDQGLTADYSRTFRAGGAGRRGW